MTVLWFLLVSGFALAGVAVLRRIAAVVLEVLREPLPPSLQPATHRSPAAPPAPARAALRAPARPAPGSVHRDDLADEAVALFTRSRAAAAGARVHPSHDGQPAYVPSWGDLLAETLREAESVRA